MEAIVGRYTLKPMINGSRVVEIDMINNQVLLEDNTTISVNNAINYLRQYL